MLSRPFRKNHFVAPLSIFFNLTDYLPLGERLIITCNYKLGLGFVTGLQRHVVEGEQAFWARIVGALLKFGDVKFLEILNAVFNVFYTRRPPVLVELVAL